MADEAGREVPEGTAVFPLIPEELGVHPLLLAVIHSIVFLEGSADDVMDAEAADEALEYIVTYLQRLSGSELSRLREDLDCLGAYARQQGWSKAQQRFLKDFLQSYGVEDEGQSGE